MLNQFIAEGLRGKSTTTIITYQYAIQQFEKWLDGAGTDLVGYSRADVQQYIDYMVSKKKAATTINNIWSAIKTYSKWAGKDNTIEDIAIVQAKNIKKEAPKALSRIERNKLIRDIDRSGNLRDYAIIMTLLMTGVRVAELVALDKTDVQISERKGSMIVRSGKGSIERKLPLHPEIRRAMQRYLDQRADDLPALFISNRRKRISIRSVQHLTEKHGHNVHKLRHTFITDLVRSGQDISVIQSLSGHSSADMILRYSQPSEDEKQQAVDQLFVER